MARDRGRSLNKCNVICMFRTGTRSCGVKEAKARGELAGVGSRGKENMLLPK